MKFELPVPILILSDGADQHTGLGRIGHDLAWVLSSMPEFRVGYIGRQAFGRAKFPWQQYSFSAQEQWGEHRIEEAWKDLSQGKRGVIFTIWDASRLLWFADPVGMPENLQEFLGPRRTFEKWGYFMQDSEGVRAGCLPLTAAEVMRNFDRVCLASKWAYTVTSNTLPQLPDCDWLPHGINTETFKPVDRMFARSAWNVKEDEIVVGCVMSNQERKQWPVVMEAIARMESRPRLWMHTDYAIQYWNLYALAHEYGITDRLLWEQRPLTDSELAMRYSACDVTTVISGGEGFCYPVAESLSCGVPVVVGQYGAQAELVEQCYQIAPRALQVATVHNVVRAVYNAEDLAHQFNWFQSWSRGQMGNGVRASVEHLDWTRLSYPWKWWLRAGLE